MDLKDFVKEALLQITAGVTAAQEQVRSSGGYINPSAVASAPGKSETAHFALLDSGQNVFLVDFDVAVSAVESAEGGAGAKLAVASLFSLQAGGKTGTTSESTSRIKFRVPLALPLDPASKKAFDDAKRKEDEMVRRLNRGE